MYRVGVKNEDGTYYHVDWKNRKVALNLLAKFAETELRIDKTAKVTLTIQKL